MRKGPLANYTLHTQKAFKLGPADTLHRFELQKNEPKKLKRLTLVLKMYTARWRTISGRGLRPRTAQLNRCKAARASLLPGLTVTARW